MAGAGEDKGVGGAFGGAPGFVGGVADVTCSHALEGGVMHPAGVGEDGGRVCGGGGHGAMIAQLWQGVMVGVMG